VKNFLSLSVTPDACVHDPSQTEKYGLVEIKCPCKYRDVLLPEHAASNSDFCSFFTEKNGKRMLNLG